MLCLFLTYDTVISLVNFTKMGNITHFDNITTLKAWKYNRAKIAIFRHFLMSKTY